MIVALIHLPSPGLAEPWTNFPLGLGYVAAAVEKAGYDVVIHDFCEGLEDIPFADIFGMQITVPQINLAKQLAKDLKHQYPHARIVAGGPQVEADRGPFIRDFNFDAMVIGEAEVSFNKLLKDWGKYGMIDRVYWKQPEQNLDDIEFPARHLFPNFKRNALRTKEMFKTDHVGGGQTTIMASRGCPWECSFCGIHSKKLRFRSFKNIFKEIQDVIDRFNIYQFKWQDDTFTCRKSWVLEFCKLIKTEFPQVYHRCHTRADVFDEEMAAAMQKAGFKFLCFGIESFSNRLLKINNKNITLKQIENSLRISKEYGFDTSINLIYGMPGENESSIAETMDGVERNKELIDYINLATMVPLPGTPILKNPEKFNVEIIERDINKYWITDHQSDDIIFVKNKDISLRTAMDLKVKIYNFIQQMGYAKPEWHEIPN